MLRHAAIAASQNALNPGALATFASPYLTSLKFPSRNPGLWPGSDISVANVYMGILPLILSLLALWQQPKSGWRWWLAGLIAFFLACSVGDRLPVRGWLYDYVPPTRYFTHPGIFRGYAMFSATVLALLAMKDLCEAVRRPESRIWRRLLVLSLITGIAAIYVYTRVVSNVDNLGNQIGLSNLQVFGMWSAAVTIALLLVFCSKIRRWFTGVFAIFAILDAALTLQLSQDFVSDAGRTRSLLKRVDADHKARLKLSSLRRQLEVSWRFGGRGNNSVQLRIATFYNDSTMKNRFHRTFADHPVLLNMGLDVDRIWFSKNATVAAPSNVVYSVLVNRSEQLGEPVIVVHPRDQMARVSEIRSLEVPDRATVASISRLEAAHRIPAQLLGYTPNDLKIKVSCPTNGWLLVTDRWAAGWRARVNGIAAEVFGGDFIFRAVRVSAGDNIIEFDYPQRLYFVLVFLSWITLILVLATAEWKRCKPALPGQ
jgi:hypothetical protein